MSFSLIGTPVSVRGATSPQTTPTYDTTGADLLIAIVCHHNAAGGTPAVSDSKGNTWTPRTAYDAGGNGHNVRIYYSVPTSVGSGHTAAFSTGGTFAYVSLFFAAFSGAHATPYDVENGAIGSADTTQQPGSVTPNQAGSLIISALAFGNVSVTPTISGGGFSAAQDLTSGSPDNGAERGTWAYIIQGSASASNPSWDTSPTTIGWAGTNAVFKPAGGGGGGEPTLSWMPVTRVVQGQPWKAVASGMTPSSDPD